MFALETRTSNMTFIFIRLDDGNVHVRAYMLVFSVVDVVVLVYPGTVENR